eukprot:g3432.t1
MAKEIVMRHKTDDRIKVSFATHNRAKEWVKATGSKYVSMGRFPVRPGELRSSMVKIMRDPSLFRGILALFNEIYLPTYKQTYEATIKIIEREKPTMMVVDVGSLGAVDAAEKMGVKVVINMPTFPFSVDISPHPWLPAWGTGFSIDMTLWDRCMNILYPRLLSVALTPAFIRLNKMRWENGLNRYGSQHDIFHGSKTIVNTAFGLDHARAVPASMEMVGPIIREDNAHQSVPEAIVGWLDEHALSSSVVFVNFGWMAKLEKAQITALLNGLTDVRLRVLWSMSNDQKSLLPQTIPPSFHIVGKAGGMSMQIVAHRAVKVVVGHCGLAVAQESLVQGKPLLCLPLFGDQADVSARVLDAKVGKVLSKVRLSAADVRKNVLEIIRANEEYSKQARRVGSLLKMAGGLDRSVSILEHYHDYSPRISERVSKMEWYRSQYFDVYTVCLSFVCLATILAFLIWRGMIRCMFHSRTRPMQKAQPVRGGEADGRSEDNDGPD